VTPAAVVPTLGRSPLLLPCLEALRREGAGIIVVDQAEIPVEIPAGLADHVLRPGRNLGFAAATNAGIAMAAGEWIATVNDDALVEPGWAGALIAALEADGGAAAAQGVNLVLDRPEVAEEATGRRFAILHRVLSPAAGPPTGRFRRAALRRSA